MRNYYTMLSVAPTAPTDEIKKAFRREIARYHPDKVQHLGKEFQEMASGIAADLTEAYRILMDPSLRAKYDDELRTGGSAAEEPEAPPRPPASDAPAPRQTPPGRSAPHAADAEAAPSAPPPPRPTAGIDFVRRATIAKVREAIDDVLGNATPLTARGFDIALVTKPKKSLFKKTDESVCLLVKFVAQVDSQSVEEAWPGASKVQAPGAAGCVLLLLGSGMSPAKALGAAVTEQRRKTRGLGPVLVPVDVRDWDALFPPDTPSVVRALIQRLKDQQR